MEYGEKRAVLRLLKHHVPGRVLGFALTMTDASPTMSRTSSAASVSTLDTSTTMTTTTPNSKSMVNLRKQVKYVVLGGVLTWYFQVVSHVGDSISAGAGTWEGRIGGVALALVAGTVGLFGYVITLPTRGHHAVYGEWTKDAVLSWAIPALTACIVLGWTALLLTLSPLGAPPPPSLSLANRISQAAAHIGLTTTTTQTTPPATASASSIEALMSRFNLSPTQSTAFTSYLATLSNRADAWAANNIRTIGWTGALAGSTGSYLLIFGSVGLLGFFAPDNRPPKQKHF